MWMPVQVMSGQKRSPLPVLGGYWASVFITGLFLGVNALVTNAVAEDAPPATEPVSAVKAVDQAKPETPTAIAPLAWSDSLAKSLLQAQRDRRPILVRGESEACPFCRVMAKELVLPQVQQELQRWNLVAIDVEKSDAEAEKLAIGAIPAFRILTPAGKVVASKEGVMSADKFAEWLKQHFDAASEVPDTQLADEGEPDLQAVFKLVGMFRNRDAAIREAAIRRLLPYPDVAGPPVVAGYSEGTLSTRLVAFELLREWQAPIQDLDPWRAETLTESRLKELSDWATIAKRKAATPARELTSEELKTVRDLLDRLPQLTPPEVTATRERLARFGKSLLPEVTTRIKAAPTDDARERLTALRYRLVATDALVLGWPGGLDRLAANDVNLRKQAADELTRRATAADEPLLLELFSDPSPLIRELSLRALRTVGASSVNSALVNLLSDPEPNVRAAVLKHLAEEPSAALVPKIVVYVLAEKDPDLVVHATRVLGELSDDKLAVGALKKLLAHESWRVRAEAVEALGKYAEKYSVDVASKADTYTGMIALLKDPDGFVVGRAITVLSNANLSAAIQPLIDVAATHPELTPEVVKALARAESQSLLAVPQIRKFLTHANPKVRATSITSLSAIAPDSIEQELRASLQDPDSDVRIAAALGVFSALERKRPSVGAIEAETKEGPFPVHQQLPEREPTTIFGGLIRIFSPSQTVRRASEIPQPVPQLTPAPELKPDVSEQPDVSEKPDAATGDPQAKGSRPSETETSGKQASEPKPSESNPGESNPESLEKPMPAEPGPVAGSPPASPSDTASMTPEPVVDEVEKTLLKIREGKVFDQKWFKLVDLLKPLLTHERIEERVAGGLALLALGQDQLALPVLEQALISDPQQTAYVATAIPFTLAADRLRLFDSLLQHAPALEELSRMISVLGNLRSPQAEEMLWKLVGNSRLNAAIADGLRDALIRYYLHRYPHEIQNATTKNKKRAMSAVLPRTRSGPAWQRLIALALLVPIDAAVANENAELLIQDVQADPLLRADALQIRFMTMPLADAQRLAISHLESDVPTLRSRALASLCLGRDRLPGLQNGRFDLQASNVTFPGETRMHGVPITPEPPAGVTAEQLQPLLKSGNPQDAAFAGYLLVLLDQPEGLPHLVTYWEEHRRDDINWIRLVYRAISRLDDATSVGILKEIFGILRKDPSAGEYQIPEYYWTIRIMTGSEILALRKTIRTEFGAENLNR